MLRVALCLALQGPTVTSATPGMTDPVGEETAQELRKVHLYVRGLAEEGLLQDLALRSQGFAYEIQTDPAKASDPEITIVLVRPRPPGYALTVLLPDGRAFDRDVNAPEEQSTRAVASTLANLLAAIADERVVADRREVNLAEELAAGGESIDGEGSAETVEETEAPEGGEATESPELDETSPDPEVPGSSAPPSEASSGGPRSWSVASSLLPVALLSLGSAPAPFAGAGIGVNVIGEAPRGLRVGGELRGGWVARSGRSLHRYRISLVGGYLVHRGRFVLATDALLGVEPWQLREDGERLALDLSGDVADEDEPSTTALAMGLRLNPGVEVVVGPKRRMRLRFGAAAEFSYTGVLASGLRAVNLSPAGDDAIFRVGGPELTLGLTMGLVVGRPGR